MDRVFMLIEMQVGALGAESLAATGRTATSVQTYIHFPGLSGLGPHIVTANKNVVDLYQPGGHFHVGKAPWLHRRAASMRKRVHWWIANSMCI